jgi:hypothetical protein
MEERFIKIKPRETTIIFHGVVITLICLAIFLPIVSIENEVEVIIESSKYEVRPGEIFTVSVRVNPRIYGISGGEIVLKYDPQIFELIDIKVGEFFGLNPIIGVKSIDKSTGMIHYAIARTGETEKPSPPGVLLILTFRTVETEYVNEGLYDIIIANIGLSDEKFEEITNIRIQNVKIHLSKEFTSTFIETYPMSVSTTILVISSIFTYTTTITQTTTLKIESIKTITISFYEPINIIFGIILILLAILLVGLLIRSLRK